MSPSKTAHAGRIFHHTHGSIHGLNRVDLALGTLMQALSSLLTLGASPSAPLLEQMARSHSQAPVRETSELICARVH